MFLCVYLVFFGFVSVWRWMKRATNIFALLFIALRPVSSGLPNEDQIQNKIKSKNWYKHVCTYGKQVGEGKRAANRFSNAHRHVQMHTNHSIFFSKNIVIKTKSTRLNRLGERTIEGIWSAYIFPSLSHFFLFLSLITGVCVDRIKLRWYFSIFFSHCSYSMRLMVWQEQQ